MDITVVAKAKAKPENVQDLIEELLKIVNPSREEKGCLQYVLLRSVEDPYLVVTIEKWATKESLALHFSQPYVKTMFARIPALLAAPSEIVILEEVPSEKLPGQSPQRKVDNIELNSDKF